MVADRGCKRGDAYFNMSAVAAVRTIEECLLYVGIKGEDTGLLFLSVRFILWCVFGQVYE